MQVRAAIEKKLTEGLAPIRLVIVDDSAKHAGHAHRIMQPGHAQAIGDTHFKIEIVSDAFAGKSRIDRHRLVNTLLAEELAGPVPALQLVTKAPGEG
jgi:BolA protein